eukprot:1862571-Prymnesium_polylepis.1
MLRCPALWAPSMVEQPFWATAEATKLDQATISKSEHVIRRTPFAGLQLSQPTRRRQTQCASVS